MARDLTTTQFNNAQAYATKPVYLVELSHAGYLERHAQIEDAVFDGQVFTADGIEVLDIQDDVSASLSLFATDARRTASKSGVWRGGKTCKIYAVPDVPGIPSDYIVTDAILVFDGIIDTSSISGNRIRITAVPGNSATQYTPRQNFSEMSDILPPAGTVFTFNGNTVTLDGYY